MVPRNPIANRDDPQRAMSLTHDRRATLTDIVIEGRGDIGGGGDATAARQAVGLTRPTS